MSELDRLNSELQALLQDPVLDDVTLDTPIAELRTLLALENQQALTFHVLLPPPSSPAQIGDAQPLTQRNQSIAEAGLKDGDTIRLQKGEGENHTRTDRGGSRPG
ncbi:hypothetical protein H4R33_003378 [Dimargaris cristalligena]|uniref:Uncharacterized protein n=1 Tax=Dimargaris cristalligena TaxID=215637 RepID=A0A4Q0A0W2_9FUNG|nr:hypothetical protein H4R33_003378 [Dimargaris cristalligena]RKP39368.1 hypothetical protein BJ085DRAFT_37781 [Dimargaris cristalligena]|eukprot:RKP39368.1 hypothetical protein BJ085DRAFT_37781 [Dimargaris cristalligena]